MRRGIAVGIGAVAALIGLASATLMGVGLLQAHARIVVASEPLPITVIGAEPEPGATDTPQPSWPSNLSVEYVEGLPEYTEVHDSETYIRVQTWIRVCMRLHGYSYMYEGAPPGGSVVGLVSMTFMPPPPGYPQQELTSLYGDVDNLARYEWLRGGCYGEAIHKAGLLDAPPSFTPDELEQIRDLYDMVYGKDETETD